MEPNQERVHHGKLTKVDRYKWKLHDEPGEMAMIDKGELEIDHSYQRDDLTDEKILKLAAEWSWVACGVLIVAERAGKWWVIDGQYRLMAAKRRSDINEMPCVVFKSEGVGEEARSFVRVNTNRRTMNFVDKHNGMLCAKDPIAVQVERLVRSGKREVSKQGGPNTIACVGLLHRLMLDRSEVTIKLWPLITAVAQGHLLHERVIQGLVYIEMHLEDGESLTSQRWAKRLEVVGFIKLLGAAQKAAAFYSRGGSKVFAIGMLEAINAGLQKRLVLKGGEE